jgi:hypothetical protein
MEVDADLKFNTHCLVFPEATGDEKHWFRQGVAR